MNDSQIRTFLMVAEHNNFSKAAELLYVSQPTVSRAIALLEKDLDTKLFQRLPNRKILLTEAGQLYYRYFRRCAREFDAVRAEVSALEQTPLTIRFAYPIGWNFSKVLPLAMEQVRQAFPEAALDVQCLSFREISTGLQKNTTDIAVFMDEPLRALGNVRHQPIANVRQVILYSHQYADHRGPILSPADFSSAVFFLTEHDREEGHDDHVRRYCSAYGFIPRFRYVKNRQTVLAMVENGMGVTLFDTWGLSGDMGSEFLFMELDSYHAVSMAWTDTLPEEAAKRFAGAFQSYYQP